MHFQLTIQEIAHNAVADTLAFDTDCTPPCITFKQIQFTNTGDDTFDSVCPNVTLAADEPDDIFHKVQSKMSDLGRFSDFMSLMSIFADVITLPNTFA